MQVFLIFRIKYCPVEVLEQPGGGDPMLNVIAMCDQGHTNVGEQKMLLADVDIALPHGMDLITWLVKYFASRNELQQEYSFHLRRLQSKWAVTWQNQQSECAPSEDSDQPGHLPSLIRVVTVRMKKPWVLSYPLSAQRRLWSDWADAQADLSLRCAHTHFVGFVMSRLKCKSR